MEDKPWKNEELKKLEEALPRLKEPELEKVSRLYFRQRQEWDAMASTQAFLWI